MREFNIFLPIQKDMGLTEIASIEHIGTVKQYLITRVTYNPGSSSVHWQQLSE
jgi:hypothetical protein